jgi:hypothetical protein
VVNAESKPPDAPYQHIAANLRGTIACGAFQHGDKLPPVMDLAAGLWRVIQHGSTRSYLSCTRTDSWPLVEDGVRSPSPTEHQRSTFLFSHICSRHCTVVVSYTGIESMLSTVSTMINSQVFSYKGPNCRGPACNSRDRD